jgi:DMSO/TMAO reductase YedYZ molybdopterin-dependent catalytic subunit
MALPQVELGTVNQCSGIRRFLSPRDRRAVVPAPWERAGRVGLKDVLDRARVKAGALQVRFNGLDEPIATRPIS